SGEPSGPPPASWLEAIGQFIAWMADQEKSSATLRCYREELAAFASWYQAEYQTPPELMTVSGSELRQFKAAQVAGKLRPATVNKKLAALKSFLRWSEARGFSLGVEAPRGVRQQPPATRWLTRSEERALVRSVERPNHARDIALVKLMLGCGLRIEE